MDILLEHALQTFQSQFPLICGVAGEDGIRYPIRNGQRAVYYEGKALDIILANKLPLEANILEWSSPRRGVFELTLDIKYVPEMHEIPCY